VSDQVIEAIGAANRWQADYNIFTQIEDVESLQPAGSGPLRDIPIAVKDLIDHAGHTTTLGSAFYREEPASTALALQRLEEAGATIIGRTGLHEFAYGFSSENQHFGPVRNPWDPDTSPGGSSGGSGAAVGAGIVPIAIGTDTGGSVRVPSALCGCYGLKVTHGKIPLDGVFPLVPSIDTVGPLADSIDNLELAYRAMSEDSETSRRTTKLRIGIPQPWLDLAPISAQVAESFESAIRTIKSEGHEVHPLEIPDLFPARPLNFAIAAEVVDVHREFRKEGKPYGDEVAARLDVAFQVSRSEFEEGRRWQHLIRQRFDDAFAKVDLLMTPTVPAMRKVIGNDQMVGTHYQKVLSWFVSVVNHALIPAIALPLADSTAPPISLQLIGPANSEPVLLETGREFESAGIVNFVPAALPEAN
jgi:aspartyl-tRNA(Asn)/glutamyl-tRNA(Gln) amidotransferase subunit A